ncbi:MAG: class I mannose-6-phosphate isomerase [Lachnospiraceae bacterium]|nr:class I mannose-6-phosphate isomerase [Lachnospiraceae bacterium]
MGILKLRPACQDYLWGGDLLKREYGVESDKEIVAEAWMLSCHPDGLSTVADGEYAGRTLKEYVDNKGEDVLGKNAAAAGGFPVLVKLIDAKKDLSIQVHPDDAYALEHEGQNGKTEFWYILDSAPDAYIYFGFKREISEEEFERRIRDNSLAEVLNRVNVKKGDVFFITPGTLHAIGKGTVIAEIQQNSNLTYRVYDYGRTGADGKQRELHVDKALDVTRIKKPVDHKINGNCLISCDYFITDRYFINNDSISITVDNNTFRHILAVSGEGSISTSSGVAGFKKGDSLFITAGTGDIEISGSAEILVTSCPG